MNQNIPNNLKTTKLKNLNPAHFKMTNQDQVHYISYILLKSQKYKIIKN